jgi:2-iminobutanoate/2-iminopropanoate deaminase
MKVKRRDILKQALAGTAGIALIASGCKTQTGAAAHVASKQSYPVEPVAVTKFGNLLFVSGIGCYEGERTIQNHTKVVMTKLHKILEENGSHINKSLRCTAWIDDINNYGPMNAVYGPLGPNGSRGTRSCMTAPKDSLPGKSLLIVDCIARI